MIRLKSKIIYSTLLSSMLVSTLTTSTLSSCSNNKNINTFVANDHTWIDVDLQKNQMINGNEHKSRVLYESSPQIRSSYSDEESFVEEQKQEYQSNLELKVETYKNQKVRDSEDVYEMLNDLSISEDNHTIDWRSTNKNFDLIKDSVLSNINSIPGLSDAKRSEIFNETNIELNELLLEAQNSKLCEEESDLFLTQGIKKLIQEKLHEKVEKALAFNELDGLLTNSDFKILSNAINPEDSTDTTSLHKLYSELNSSSNLKAQTEDSLLPLLFEYRDLPLSKSTIPGYELGFNVIDMTWTDCVTANMTLAFYLSDINTHEKLASYKFENISITDNKNGQIEAANKYVDLINFTSLSQENLPEYSAFLNSLKQFDPYSTNASSNEYFVSQTKLNSLGDIFVSDAVSNINADSCNGAIVDGVFAIGAIVDFNESISNVSKQISLKLCLYNPNVNSQKDSILSINPNTINLTLNNDSDDQAKEVAVSQLEMTEIQEGFASFVDMYKYLNDPSIKKLHEESSDNANTLSTLHKVKFWMDVVVSASSLILDIVTHSFLFAIVDLGLGAFDCWLTNKIKKQFFEQKLLYDKNLSNYKEAKESDIYKEVDKLLNDKSNNFQQVLRELTKELNEFTTPSDEFEGARNLKNANKLIEEFKEKYHLLTNEEVLELVKEKTLKFSAIANHAIDTYTVINSKVKIDAISSAIEFNTKMKQLDSMVSGFDDIIVCLAGGTYYPLRSRGDIFKGWFGNGLQNVSFVLGNDASFTFFGDIIVNPKTIRDAYSLDYKIIQNATDINPAFKDMLLTYADGAFITFDSMWSELYNDTKVIKNEKWLDWNTALPGRYLVDDTGIAQTVAFDLSRRGINCFDSNSFLDLYKQQMLKNVKASNSIAKTERAVIAQQPAAILNNLTPEQFFKKYYPNLSNLDTTLPERYISKIKNFSSADKELLKTEMMISLPGFYNDCKYSRSDTILPRIASNGENTVHSIPDYVFNTEEFKRNVNNFNNSTRTRDLSVQNYLNRNGVSEKANQIYLETAFDKSLDINEVTRVSVKEYKESTSGVFKRKFAKIVSSRDCAYKLNSTIFSETDKKIIERILKDSTMPKDIKAKNLAQIASKYSTKYAVVDNGERAVDLTHLDAIHISETATTNLGWLKVTKALIFVSIAGSILFMFYSQAVDFVTDIFDFSK